MSSNGKPPSDANVKLLLTINMLSELIRSNIFYEIDEHAYETEPLNNHRLMLSCCFMLLQYKTTSLRHQAHFLLDCSKVQKFAQS